MSCSNKLEYNRAYRKTIRGKACAMWVSVSHRVENKIGNRPTYANVKLLMTRQEFLDWVIPELEEWVKTKPLCGMEGASLDRKENDGHYELSNLQIISNADNSKKKSDNKNINPPEGKAWCSICKDYLDRSEFFKFTKNQHGLAYRCKYHAKQSYDIWKSRNPNYQKEWLAKRKHNIQDIEHETGNN